MNGHGTVNWIPGICTRIQQYSVNWILGICTPVERSRRIQQYLVNWIPGICDWEMHLRDIGFLKVTEKCYFDRYYIVESWRCVSCVWRYVGCGDWRYVGCGDV